MKFGRKISVSGPSLTNVRTVSSHRPKQNDLYSEWRSYYLDYNKLKRELKVRHPSLPLFGLEVARDRTARSATSCGPADTEQTNGGSVPAVAPYVRPETNRTVPMTEL